MNPVQTQKPLTHSQQRELLKANRKIVDMSTNKIVGFLLYRHRFTISVTANAALLTFVIVKLV